MKVGILGGGLTGLSLGKLLAEKGVDFEILEKEQSCGGLMRSIEEEGFTFDYGGSHIIFSKDQEAMDFLTSSLGSNLVSNRRNTKILFGKRYVKYPFENGLSGLPDEDNFECVRYFIENLVRKRAGKVMPPTNLKEWFYYSFGKGISEKYLVPYNEKIWKYDLEKTSMEWVERIPNPPVEDIIKSSVGIETEGYTHQLHFLYPESGGIEAIIKSLESRIMQSVRTGFEVASVSRENGMWKVSGKEGGKYSAREYDIIVSTMPVQALVDSLGDAVPETVRNASRRLEYNSIITAMIGIDRDSISDISWLYIPDRQILTHRISFPSNYSPLNAPEGKSSILAEITCRFGDDIWNMKDDEIKERMIVDLEKAGIIKRQEVCFFGIRKLRYAYVINDLEYSSNSAIVRDFMKSVGIGLVGRFSEFRYLNMDGCVRSAMDFVCREFGNMQSS